MRSLAPSPRTTLAVLLAVAMAAITFLVLPSTAATASSSVGLYVSTQADRSAATLLGGSTLAGDVFVFWSKSPSPNDTTGAKRVDFSLDGVGVRSELVTPFDLGGTAGDGTALPFSLGSLRSGAHTIAAKVFPTKGSTTTYTATFSVGTSTSTTTSTTAATTTTSTTAASTTTTTAPSTSLAPASTSGGKVRFASSSFWYQMIPSSTALDPHSADYVASFNTQWKTYYNNVGVNTTRYAPPIFVASDSTPTRAVRVWDCQNKGYLDAGLQSQLSAVPIPAGTQPSAGTDGELVISQPSTDTVWEMWKARWASDGVLEACWGGKLSGVSTSQGSYAFPYGTTATGLSLAGGIITPEELKAGHIDHALSIALVETRKTIFSWPANRTDGYVDSLTAIPEGQRFRLDPTINVDALPITATAKIIAKALQTYGMVVRDKSGSVTFYAENVLAETGSDPYPALFGAPNYSVLNGVPWDRLQALPFDFGK